MKSAALVRSQIEASLQARIPVALSPRGKVEPIRVPCGVAEIDELLDGGLPVGMLTEFVGEECSGRTSMALAYVAAITQAGTVCAWVDVADALDPESSAANGVDLARLLWIRCGEPQQGTPETMPEEDREGDASSPGALASSLKPLPAGGGGPHPRTEGRDMPEAIVAMLRAHGGLYDKQMRREKRSVGTPGAANRPVSYRSESREQIDSDRMPPRRGDNLDLAPRCAEPQPRRRPSQFSGEPLSAKTSKPGTVAHASRAPWKAIDQALRATDLLLQGGGFSAIVLDLASLPAEYVWRIPMATWFRFRAACERTRVSLLVLTQHPCTRSSAELVVRLQPGDMETEDKVMTGVHYRAATERSRSPESGPRVVPIRKPPQPERAARERPGRWKMGAAWAQAK